MEPTADEIRLGELVDRFQEMRASDASLGIGSFVNEAGALFDQLTELSDCLDALQVGMGRESTDIPAQVGPYVIEATLGAGASGTVYRARRSGDGPAVALKVIRDSMVYSDEAHARFESEIELAERLDHKNIARVLDHGEWDGRPAYAMEFLPGGSLQDLLDRIESRCGPEPGADWLAMLDAAGVAPAERPGKPAETYARRLAALFAPVARALAHAARAGLVHRDVKPANLLLAGDGRLVLTDFGLAKVFDRQLTTTGAVLGTPRFMSPEQASGKSRQADTRCDVYGLGASLYRALTGKAPIDGQTFEELMAAILTTEPEPLESFHAGYPAELSRVVLRSLEKDPGDRYADGETFADDLERVSRGGKGTRLPAKRRAARFARRRRGPLVAGAAALVLLALGLWWFTRPAHVEIRTYPAAHIAWDDETLAQANWTGRVTRGTHLLQITRERFHAHREFVDLGAGQRALLSIHLRPLDPFDTETLQLLAQSYEVAEIGDSEPPRARGSSNDPVPAPKDPDALARELERWPAKERARPAIRLLAARSLFDKGLFAEAYAAARAVSDEHPDQALPARFCLDALAQLGLEGTKTYADLYERYSDG
ncbi:MAG: serine/threonine-protein kinase [Planctomycetota bacterium]